jgi:hypothetical protein
VLSDRSANQVEWTSLAHVNRLATETQSRITREWIQERLKCSCSYTPKKKWGIRAALKKIGRGLPPDGVRSWTHWDPPCGHKKGRVGRLLVVRLRKETVAWSLVWWVSRVEARVSCPQKEGRKDHREEKGAGSAEK